ncbi:MAG TPA: hemerythrin family protein [Anaeromyxobacteraceae bacterium]|nr:hemerythrin family protein [Anaeromyxobacteraceae bacterium]
MGTLQWTPALSVGNADIDEQHQELFRRAERLILALRSGDRSEVEPLVGYLTDYVVSHFEAEERLMRESRFPGLAEHKAAHEGFRREFHDLFLDFRRKGATALVALSLHNWLAAWLKEHVSGLDTELAGWLSRRSA